MYSIQYHLIHLIWLIQWINGESVMCLKLNRNPAWRAVATWHDPDAKCYWKMQRHRRRKLMLKLTCYKRETNHLIISNDWDAQKIDKITWKSDEHGDNVVNLFLNRN